MMVEKVLFNAHDLVEVHTHEHHNPKEEIVDDNLMIDEKSSD